MLLKPSSLNAFLSSKFTKMYSTVKPKEIRFKKDEKALYIKWSDIEFRYPAEYLRIYDPSVQSIGLGGKKRLVCGRKYVSIIDIVPQGNYGIGINFDDLHETGIYSWDYLRYLGDNKIRLMKEYIRALREAGKSRDPKLNVVKPVKQE